MDTPEFLTILGNLRRNTSNGVRAPHKPLLLLYALARLKDGQERIRYRDAASILPTLIRTYGPVGTRARASDPFVRLRSDGIWSLDAHSSIFDASGQGRPAAMADADTLGGFTTGVLELLHQQPALIDQAVRRILDTNFPASLHEDIAAAVGLDLEGTGSARRDPRFRDAVLRAYLCECAVCRFQLRCGDGLVGLEAAHLRWHAFGGGSDIANGLSLCVLHHRLFDLGVLTLTLDGRVEVSRSISGPSARGLFDLDGAPVLTPIDPAFRPGPQNVEWHRRQVFRG
ncbi:hypothetical protein D3093_35315 (plasmid) [Azospirillum argentinense]|uniref:Restriction endonuclease n=1 Tax=Azospirillum argentinense TaxID=2970906 RepID=A0A4D8PRT8_9PROT|nr:HNH endonuclease [Azospirillum argentinense]QCO00517.1 hypothetical protein D3093_35315 [Azospirillum argentinense]